MAPSQSSKDVVVLAIDPGRDKCGYAVVESKNGSSKVLASGIVSSSEISPTVVNLCNSFPEAKIIGIGNGTAGRAVHDVIAKILPNLPIQMVDEHGTSEQARAIYLQRNPAIGIAKLIPHGLRTPNKPYDYIVAELIALKIIASW